MKKVFVIVLVFVGAQAWAMSVDHTGLLNSVHRLEVDENTIRVELHRMNEMRVFSTGERGNRQGELNQISVKLEGLNEYEYTTWNMPFDIFNRTKGIRGGSGYIDIDRNDRLELSDGNRTDASGELPLKETQWINARRGARFMITIKSNELDCSGQRVCGRGDDGTVVYEMTIPPLPANLPRTCGGANSLNGAVIDGAFQFAGMLDYTRVASGNPIIEPSVDELDSFLCFLPVQEEE
tara:strand:+ start:1258 stop:1968 length:711 start_codon:yes stop_codon:yes gene_type:complete